ncbi:MAG: hypothetical protein LBL66_05995 [Clostridiales bacterium]|jgi:hypothetical protein|nr:hypothetical protein [Clostridiales bacterium]
MNVIRAHKVPGIGASYAEPLSGDYKARIGGTECPVYVCRVSAIPFNVWWKGRQRPVGQSELASTVSFEADGPVVLEVECAREFQRAVLRPLSKNVTPGVAGKTVKLALEKPGQYVLELDGEHFCLHIFFNPVKDFPEREGAAYRFGPGIHFPGLIRLKDGDSVYIDGGAVVYGSIFGDGVKNVRVFGYGVLDGSYEERLTAHCVEDYTKGNLKFYDSGNIRIEGVTLRNSAIWCVNFFGCWNVFADNIKVVGQWRYNTDGIDIVNSQNVAIRDSFVRSFDDTIVLKGIDKYDGIDVKNIRVENCVLWCGWGGTLEIGFETACREYADILFADCDLIHNTNDAMRIHHGDYAEVHGVTYRDIRVEFQKGGAPPLIQQSYEQEYEPNGAVCAPGLFTLYNPRFRQEYAQFDNVEFNCADYDKKRGADGKVATIRDVLFENIAVYLEGGAPKPPSLVQSTVPGTEFYGITFRNITFNGKKARSAEELNMTIGAGTRDIKIC